MLYIIDEGALFNLGSMSKLFLLCPGWSPIAGFLYACVRDPCHKSWFLIVWNIFYLWSMISSEGSIVLGAVIKLASLLSC